MELKELKSRVKKLIEDLELARSIINVINHMPADTYKITLNKKRLEIEEKSTKELQELLNEIGYKPRYDGDMDYAYTKLKICEDIKTLLSCEYKSIVKV